MNDRDVKIPFEKYALLKAETVLAELMSNGIAETELKLHFESSFKKVFRTDINKISYNHFNDDVQRGSLEVYVNRDSLYDLLPEGVFHQPLAATAGANLSSMIADSRRLKKEEKMARQFFAPFDQQFLLFSTLVEQEERYWLKNIEAGNFTKDPYTFWDIPSTIPYPVATTLSAILPWAYLIKGNQPYIAKALEMVLQKKVSIHTITQLYQPASTAPRAIEDMYLGEDAVLGYGYFDETIIWKITIHNISGAEMQEYIPGGKMGNLITYINDIFLPVEIEAQFEFELEKKVAENFTPVLGYGFFL